MLVNSQLSPTTCVQTGNTVMFTANKRGNVRFDLTPGVCRLKPVMLIAASGEASSLLQRSQALGELLVKVACPSRRVPAEVSEASGVVKATRTSKVLQHNNTRQPQRD